MITRPLGKQDYDHIVQVIAAAVVVMVAATLTGRSSGRRRVF